jgi:hypothetical protein
MTAAGERIFTASAKAVHFEQHNYCIMKQYFFKKEYA